MFTREYDQEISDLVLETLEGSGLVAEDMVSGVATGLGRLLLYYQFPPEALDKVTDIMREEMGEE